MSGDEVENEIEKRNIRPNRYNRFLFMDLFVAESTYKKARGGRVPQHFLKILKS
jgi:hypothetical protein